MLQFATTNNNITNYTQKLIIVDCDLLKQLFMKFKAKTFHSSF